MSRDRLPAIGLGTVITLVGSAIPFSPVLGGGFAGWVAGTTPREGAKLGGLTGVIASLVLIPLVLFGLVAFAILSVRLVSALLFALVLTGGVYFIGGGFLGGYVGVLLREEYAGSSQERTDSQSTDDKTVEDELTAIKRRYANGELSDIEFERRLEDILDESDGRADAWKDESTERELERR